MIARNEQPEVEPGRNDPCPCASGLKYKKWCIDPNVKAVRTQLARDRVLIHLCLDQLQNATGAAFIGVTLKLL